MFNWTIKKIFKRDVEYVVVFLKFLIQSGRRRLEKIEQGNLVDQESDNSIFEKLKLVEFEKDWEMKIHFNRLFESKDGMEWYSLVESLKILNFGNEELINKQVVDMEKTLKMYLDGWEEYLENVLDMEVENYIERGTADLNRKNYNIDYIAPEF